MGKREGAGQPNSTRQTTDRKSQVRGRKSRTGRQLPACGGDTIWRTQPSDRGHQGRTIAISGRPTKYADGARGGHRRRYCRGSKPLDGRKLRLRSEEHTSELQSRQYLVCRLLLEKK